MLLTNLVASDLSIVGRFRSRIQHQFGVSAVSDQLELGHLRVRTGRVSTKSVRVDELAGIGHLPSSPTDASGRETEQFAD